VLTTLYENNKELKMESKSKSKIARKRSKVDSPFASILSAIMKDRGLSLKAVAGMADVGSPVVSSWLNGAVPHDPKAVQRLARGLQISFEHLLTGEITEPTIGALSLQELFREENAFSGLYRIEAKRLVRKTVSKK
jgi:transcriptional regulator with XRE-family HTH domain